MGFDFQLQVGRKTYCNIRHDEDTGKFYVGKKEVSVGLRTRPYRTGLDARDLPENSSHLDAVTNLVLSCIDVESENDWWDKDINGFIIWDASRQDSSRILMVNNDIVREDEVYTADLQFCKYRFKKGS